VGGADQKIILYTRENNSGTYEFFKEHVLKKKDFTPFAQCLPGTASVANAVARDKRGIGYGGAAYAKGIRFCAIKPDESSPGICPTVPIFRRHVTPSAETSIFICAARGRRHERFH
jgi:phosphate transport system substrate-binding protein